MLDHLWPRMMAVFTGALLLGACAQDSTLDEGSASAAMSRADEAAADIFYARQEEADADLMRFDRDNPQCQLWTNWQKMCTRTGAAGQTECVTDQATPVRPSVPFCLWAAKPKFGSPPEEPKQLASASRFCNGELHDREYLRCSAPIAKRPFDGRTLSARRSKYCSVWAEEGSGKPICAERELFDELPRCEALVVQGFRSQGQLYCAREVTNLAEMCSEPSGFSSGSRSGFRPSYPNEAASISGPILALLDSSETYVSAMYCEDGALQR